MTDFQKNDGTIIKNIDAYINEWTKQHPNCEIYVGCDSQRSAGHIVYVTAICMYNIGKGAHVIYRKEKEPSTPNLYNRLWHEVEKSIQVANQININKKIVIHLDYNSKHGEKSNAIYETGIGYAKSLGYEAVGKPIAYGATYAADKHCR